MDETMNATTECKPVTLTMEDVVAECNRLRKELQRRDWDVERAYRDGMIDGLKYAMRYNGVSGGEVR